MNPRERTLRLALFGALLLIAAAVPAGAAGPEEPRPTGNLRVDLVGLSALRTGPLLQDVTSPSPLPSRKSIWIAAGLSVLVPGAGEFYAESYWKAALFFAVEVAVLAVAYSYDRRGNTQTDSYREFANRNWSVVKYAQYAQTLAPPENTYTWRIQGTEGMDPFDRPWTQVNWAELNRMERDIAVTPPSQYYSHTLPPYGDQQYFELIGKYPQFNQGWNDAPPAFNYGDPLTPKFLYYSGERGKANEYYTNATRWVTIAIVNHLLSALDAAWSAAMFNSAQATMGMRVVPAGDGYATVAVLRVEVPF